MKETNSAESPNMPNELWMLWRTSHTPGWIQADGAHGLLAFESFEDARLAGITQAKAYGFHGLPLRVK